MDVHLDHTLPLYVTQHICKTKYAKDVQISVVGLTSAYRWARRLTNANGHAHQEQYTVQMRVCAWHATQLVLNVASPLMRSIVQNARMGMCICRASAIGVPPSARHAPLLLTHVIAV